MNAFKIYDKSHSLLKSVISNFYYIEETLYKGVHVEHKLFLNYF